MPGHILYARKSTESEDRQILSIDSQVRELQSLARSRGLTVAATYTEAKSAKAPGRLVFGEVLRRLARGDAEGLLCWKLDRLARNPIDGGALIWALDSGQLKEIVTPQAAFGNTGNDKFWMQLEFGMAKKYVDDLSDNVKRGHRAKLEQGWAPGLPPLGYQNDLATRTVVPDPERFPLIRQIFDMVLAGHSPARVLDVANRQWGFRTRPMRRQGGRPLSRTAIYKLLGNPYYYGLIIRKGEAFAGAHPPVVTKQEFETVQELLGRPTRYAKRRHEFAYTGLIRCGECGAAVTAEQTVNRFGSRYVYYHCTKRLTTASCSQKTIRVERLEEQIAAVLARLTIPADYFDWGLGRLKDMQAKDTRSSHARRISLDDARRDIQARLSLLMDLRVREQISDDEFSVKRQELVGEQLELGRQAQDAGDGEPAWFEPSRNALLYAREAAIRFSTGQVNEKREIVLALGSNLVLRDNILRIQLHKPFEILASASISKGSLGKIDTIQTFLAKFPRIVQWPRFCRS